MGKVENLEQAIERVQQSSRTLFPFMLPAHEWLRLRSRMYYTWHLNPYASNVHWATFLTAFVAVAVGIVTFLSPFSAQPQAAAGILKQFPFQGRLTNSNGTVVANGNYDMVFKLYTVDTGGTAAWTETWTGGNQVTVTNGIFNVMLGSITSLGSIDFNTDTWYIGITVGVDSEMTPRMRLGAAPFAFNADQLDGRDESAFALLAGRSSGQNLNGGTAASENLTLSSTANATKGKILFGTSSAYDDTNFFLGVGTATPTARLHLAGNMSGTPGTGGSVLRLNSMTFTDNATAASGTAATMAFNAISTPTLAATNTGVTTTQAATFYILGAPTAGTNQTITHPYSLWVDAGDVRLDKNVKISDDNSNVPAAKLHLGNLGFTVNTTVSTIGYGLSARAVTFTDNSTAASGSIGSVAANSFGQPTWVATNSSVTHTNSATLYVDNAPAASTNITITNPFALWVDDGNVRFDANLMIGTGSTATPTARLHIGNAAISGTPGLSGHLLRSDSVTFTDTATVASGTATNMVFTGLATPTLAATNTSVTTTNAATFYIAAAPTAGTNQTITNPYALWVDAGNVRFDGNLGLGITGTPSSQLHIKPATAAALQIDPFSTGTGNTGEFRFLELAANGTNYVGFKAPDAIGSSNPIWTLPSADGSSGQALTTNGSGVLSFGSASTQQMTRSFTVASGESITAGDVVSLINGEAYEGIGETFGSEASFNAAGTQSVDVIALSATKFVVIYNDLGNSSFPTAVVGDISGTTITFGSEQVVNSAAGVFTYIAVDALDSSKVVFMYANGTTLTTRVATISGTTFTFGTAVNVETSLQTGTQAADVTRLGASSFIVCYADTTPNGACRAATVSGTTITLGTETVFSAGASALRIRLDNLADDNFVFVYQNSTNAFVRNGSVSGTTITYQSATTLPTTSVTIQAVGLTALGTDRFVATVLDNGTPLGYAGKVFSNSFPVIGARKTILLNFSHTFTDVSSTIMITPETFGYAIDTTADVGIIGRCNVVGIEIENCRQENTFNNASTSSVGIASLGQELAKYVVAYTTTVSIHGRAKVGYSRSAPIGIAGAAATGGQSVSVITNGVSSVHSGLTTGQSYFVDDTSNSGTISTTFSANLIGRALSATELLLDPDFATFR